MFRFYNSFDLLIEQLIVRFLNNSSILCFKIIEKAVFGGGSNSQQGFIIDIFDSIAKDVSR